MNGEIETEKDSDWRKFIRKHWGIVVVFALAVALVLAAAVYVFWWFAGNAQATNMVPSTLGLWTMNNLVMFVLHLIFWELVLIGIPVAVGAVLGWQWWKRLPAEEKVYHPFGRRSRSRNAGGGFSLFLFIAFAIKVYIDGNWNVAFATYTLDYVIDSMLWILIWSLIIIGIPIAIGVIWWIHHELDRKP
jgi:hypothetical protein